MDENNNKNTEEFNYSYHAPTAIEKKQIESIRRQYLPKEMTSTKLDELNKLDKKVKTFPTVLGIVIGITGTLIFGLGLSMILEWELILFGILVSALGAIILAVAYPIHNYLMKKRKAQYKNEIIKLSDELLNENNTN